MRHRPSFLGAVVDNQQLPEVLGHNTKPRKHGNRLWFAESPYSIGQNVSSSLPTVAPKNR
jgi:hypothetical protein